MGGERRQGAKQRGNGDRQRRRQSESEKGDCRKTKHGEKEDCIDKTRQSPIARPDAFSFYPFCRRSLHFTHANAIEPGSVYAHFSRPVQ